MCAGVYTYIYWHVYECTYTQRVQSYIIYIYIYIYIYGGVCGCLYIYIYTNPEIKKHHNLIKIVFTKPEK